jgi:hypothetical protein
MAIGGVFRRAAGKTRKIPGELSIGALSHSQGG